ncbi:unnamed protein product [Cuscuta campestris]|uniref:DUF1985 domain-containing protein n=1 Tax=Cuscuta campestris TaxID=132261 RepID=A0A484LV80_9ASTE|nr:unnamed protein product [Cuscuta campestris]
MLMKRMTLWAVFARNSLGQHSEVHLCQQHSNLEPKGSGEAYVKELVQFSMLYFVECFLLAKDKGARVDFSHLELIDNIEKFEVYSWGDHPTSSE